MPHTDWVTPRTKNHHDSPEASRQRVCRSLARPDRLTSDEVLADAEQVLIQAEEIDSPGPVLSEQITKLGQQLDIARTTIPVVLLSDERTEVLVYRVGRLGSFERKQLELRPGVYTVVGTRAGFRDVRHQLEVAPGGSMPSLTISCKEKI